MLTAETVIISVVLGLLLMMFPIALQKIKRMPFFRQDIGAASEPVRVWADSSRQKRK